MEGDFPPDSSLGQPFLGNDDTNNVLFNDSTNPQFVSEAETSCIVYSESSLDMPCDYPAGTTGTETSSSEGSTAPTVAVAPEFSFVGMGNGTEASVQEPVLINQTDSNPFLPGADTGVELPAPIPPTAPQNPVQAVPTQEVVPESEDEGADEDEEDDSKLKPVELEMKGKAGWVWIPVARLRRMSKEELQAHHLDFKNMQLTPGQKEALEWQKKRVKDRVGGQVKRKRDREARKKCEEYEKENKRLCTELERLRAEVERLMGEKKGDRDIIERLTTLVQFYQGCCVNAGIVVPVPAHMQHTSVQEENRGEELMPSMPLQEQFSVSTTAVPSSPVDPSQV